jgi:glutathione synthase/RimK-type ligase-like ATP-grasp enzyme
MNTTSINIAVCQNENNWHQRFIQALESIDIAGCSLHYDLVNVDIDRWVSALEGFDVVLWKPNHMGVESASYLKEKIYFIEKYLNKLVIPNFNTVWHFESKVAQKYIFEKFNIPSPRTVSSFNYEDALERLSEFTFPVVFKKSAGAASTNVRLVKTFREAKGILRRIFYKQASEMDIKKRGNLLGRLSLSYLRLWLDWNDVVPDRGPNQQVVYWQEFIDNNPADLRITVIGNKYAFGFWRKNRPNDFRASGSGRLDYSTPIPEHVVQYCMGMNESLKFDSMAYDILFTGESFKIVEMSYGYMDTAVHNSKGYYEFTDTGLIFHEGNFWPQEIWIKWIIDTVVKHKNI